MLLFFFIIPVASRESNNSIPLGSIPGSRASLSSVLAGMSKPATPHQKLRALGPPNRWSALCPRA